METTIVYWGYIGIMEKKTETTMAYWGYVGILEMKMETTTVYWGSTGIIKKENGSYHVGFRVETFGLYWAHGKENGNYDVIVYYGIP